VLSQRWIVIAAALTTTLLVVGVLAYAAGSKGLFGGSSNAAVAPPSGSATASRSGGTQISPSSAGTPGASTVGSTPTPGIFDCPNSFTSELYVCVSSATFANGKLTIAFKANTTLSNGQDINSHHLHLFLANPKTDGSGTDPDASIMEHIGPAQGNWWNFYSNDSTTIDDTTKSSNGKKISAEAPKYTLFCARVAAGLHILQKDRKGGLASGNCVKITK
jgi:hypothetical protein